MKASKPTQLKAWTKEDFECSKKVIATWPWRVWLQIAAKTIKHHQSQFFVNCGDICGNTNLRNNFSFTMIACIRKFWRRNLYRITIKFSFFYHIFPVTFRILLWLKNEQRQQISHKMRWQAFELPTIRLGRSFTAKY